MQTTIRVEYTLTRPKCTVTSSVQVQATNYQDAIAKAQAHVQSLGLGTRAKFRIV